jgi:hypothetical protein
VVSYGVESALRSLAKPINVAEWQTKLVENVPDDRGQPADL